MFTVLNSQKEEDTPTSPLPVVRGVPLDTLYIIVAVGCVVFIILVIAIVVCCYVKRTKKSAAGEVNINDDVSRNNVY